jgi:hypothetical protein
VSFFDDVELTPEQAERAAERAATGKALVVVVHGEPFVIAWQAGMYLSEMMSGQGASGETFAPGECGFDMEVPPDGVYLCDLGWVDDGPGDWPGSREVVCSIKEWQPATKEQWQHHLKNEWPWEPLE